MFISHFHSPCVHCGAPFMAHRTEFMDEACHQFVSLIDENPEVASLFGNDFTIHTCPGFKPQRGRSIKSIHQRILKAGTSMSTPAILQ